ncbi:response regulator [candidate division KSB1 bacterium]|nr:response regulator [candidate division KSB1 bacterium]
MQSNSYKRNTDVDILIVEDSPTQAAKLKQMLENENYKIRIAKNGEEGWDLLEERLPNVVISDVIMPGIDGYELCRRIKHDKKCRHLPVILLTQLSDPKDIIHGLESGADHFITKPYSEDELLSHIQYIFVNRELRKNPRADLGIEIFFAGQKHFLTSDRIQILDLLFSTYEAVLQKNQELEKKNLELQSSIEMIKTLRGLIPICSHCKKIRNDEGFWQRLEEYIHENSEAEFTHGLCPDCEKTIYSKYFEEHVENHSSTSSQ